MPRESGRERRGNPCRTDEPTRVRRPVARRIQRIGFLLKTNEFTGENGYDKLEIWKLEINCIYVG